MSDNDDLLGEDLGDHSLADYNLGNEEEEQLLADDYEGAGSHSVPSSVAGYQEPLDVGPSDYSAHRIEYGAQQIPYQPVPETECVVPNITVEVPNVPPLATYAPYEPRHYDVERAVPPAIPAAPIESPQIVPSEVSAPISNGDMSRERFTSERPIGAQRMPQVRDIPDTLDKVVIPRGGAGYVVRGRTSWRNPQFNARYAHPYRRNNTHRGNFVQRHSFPPPQQIRPNILPARAEIRPEIRPDIIRNDIIRTDIIRNDMIRNDMIRNDMIRTDIIRTEIRLPPPGPNIEQAQARPVPYTPQMPGIRFPARPAAPKEPEVRMLPVPLPPHLPLPGKKVLINPHFKGNFQPPVDVLPAYIPTRIQKSPPLSPTLENKFGPIKDIDDAAERFIAEQRNALARAAGRKFVRRSPQRYIENTTIEIENDLARRGRDSEEDDLLRRQEEFIHANRAGLRRRMRSPSPPRRSPSPPRRSPPRRPPPREKHERDEDSEYKRRLREQESMRERVLRAKELRRRRNAIQTHEREQQEKEKELQKEKDKDKPACSPPLAGGSAPWPDSSGLGGGEVGGASPAHSPGGSPPAPPAQQEVNSTCDAEGTPPPRACSDDELELILGDIDGILSDDDDARPANKPEPSKSKPVTDLRTKLPPKTTSESKRPPRQKIVFENNDQKKKEKSPPRRAVVTSSTKSEDTETEKKSIKIKTKTESVTKSRTRITFDNEEAEKDADKQSFTNRRVILQRKTGKDKSVFSRVEAGSAGIFSRAVRTLAPTRARSPRLEVESPPPPPPPPAAGGDLPAPRAAVVTQLPPAMTHARLTSLAGDHVQSLILNKEDRSAKIVFKTSTAAENFKKKFNNKMVAASLTVTLK